MGIRGSGSTGMRTGQLAGVGLSKSLASVFGQQGEGTPMAKVFPSEWKSATPGPTGHTLAPRGASEATW